MVTELSTSQESGVPPVQFSKPLLVRSSWAFTGVNVKTTAMTAAAVIKNLLNFTVHASSKMIGHRFSRSGIDDITSTTVLISVLFPSGKTGYPF